MNQPSTVSVLLPLHKQQLSFVMTGNELHHRQYHHYYCCLNIVSIINCQCYHQLTIMLLVTMACYVPLLLVTNICYIHTIIGSIPTTVRLDDDKPFQVTSRIILVPMTGALPLPTSVAWPRASPSHLCWGSTTLLGQADCLVVVLPCGWPSW